MRTVGFGLLDVMGMGWSGGCAKEAQRERVLWGDVR
jgi:hypothetical protein